VVEKDGTLVGIVEAHDLLKVEPANHQILMRELARQDFVRAYPEEMVDRVNREMLSKNLENVIVFESAQSQKVIGTVRANDILQLRRWFIEEETRQPRISTGKTPA
jgi:predicted transcriptional regulator